MMYLLPRGSRGYTVSLCHCVTVWQLAINVIVPFFLLGLRHRPLDDKRGTGLQVV